MAGGTQESAQGLHEFAKNREQKLFKRDGDFDEYTTKELSAIDVNVPVKIFEEDDDEDAKDDFEEGNMKAGGSSDLEDEPTRPMNANIFSTIDSSDKQKLIQLETTTAKEVKIVVWLTTISVLWAVILMPVGTAFARDVWVPAGCTATQCDEPSFRKITFVDFITSSIVILFNVIYLLVYAWTVLFKIEKVRPETWWALCLSPVVIIANNPLLYLDRVPELIDITPQIASIMAVCRYISNAIATTGFTLYVIAKFGSLSRDENVDEPYPWSFYLLRGCLGIILFVLMLSLTLLYRVEISAQPLVSLVSLGRQGTQATSTTGVYISAISVGVTQAIVFGFFFFAYYSTSRRIRKRNYMDTRLKHLNLQFFWSHTFLPLGCTILSALLCSVLYPIEMANYRSPSLSGDLTEKFVLDVPYYLRSGIVFVYSMYAAVEAYFALPAQYKPSWIEAQLRNKIKRTSAMLGVDEEIRPRASQEETCQEKQFPLEWHYNRKEDGTVYKDPTKLVFEEMIFMFNLSWLVYCSDEVIEACMLDQVDLGSPYRLRNIWRESMRDLVLIVLESPDNVVVVFRGTVSPKNWKINFMMGQAVHPPEEDPEWLQGKWRKPSFGGREPRVHQGFWMAYESIREELLKDLEECFQEVPTRKRLLCAGHSLGGALATLIAFDARLVLGMSEENVSLVTFGSPKVGNRAFARRFNAVLLDNFRIVNHSDAITNVPKTYVTHFEHVPRGILVDQHGNMIIDPLYVDVKFFHGNSLLPHMMSSYRDALNAVHELSGNRSYTPDFWDFSRYECIGYPDQEAVANLVSSTPFTMGKTEVVDTTTASVASRSGAMPEEEGCRTASVEVELEEIDVSTSKLEDATHNQANAHREQPKTSNTLLRKLASVRPGANLDQNPLKPSPVTAEKQNTPALRTNTSLRQSAGAVGIAAGSSTNKRPAPMKRFSSIRPSLGKVNLDQNPLAASGGVAVATGGHTRSATQTSLNLNLSSELIQEQDVDGPSSVGAPTSSFWNGPPSIRTAGNGPSSSTTLTKTRSVRNLVNIRSGKEGQSFQRSVSLTNAKNTSRSARQISAIPSTGPFEMRNADSTTSMPQIVKLSSMKTGGLDGVVYQSGNLRKYIPSREQSNLSLSGKIDSARVSTAPSLTLGQSSSNRDDTTGTINVGNFLTKKFPSSQTNVIRRNPSA